MPTLKNLSCCVQWPNSTPFIEYGLYYGDGVAETYIAVPDYPQEFTIHLRSHGYIYDGLAMLVYIDGNYQCNRNRLNLVPPKKDKAVSKTEIDFLVRQKEKPNGNGVYIGRVWRFDNHNIVDSLPEGIQESHFDELGTIEVLVLRCKARNIHDANHEGSSSCEDSDVGADREEATSTAIEITGPVPNSTVCSQPAIPPHRSTDDLFDGLMGMGLFDGASDPPDHVQGGYIWHQSLAPPGFENLSYPQQGYYAPAGYPGAGFYQTYPEYHRAVPAGRRTGLTLDHSLHPSSRIRAHGQHPLPAHDHRYYERTHERPPSRERSRSSGQPPHQSLPGDGMPYVPHAGFIPPPGTSNPPQLPQIYLPSNAYYYPSAYPVQSTTYMNAAQSSAPAGHGCPPQQPQQSQSFVVNTLPQIDPRRVSPQNQQGMPHGISMPPTGQNNAQPHHNPPQDPASSQWDPRSGHPMQWSHVPDPNMFTSIHPGICYPPPTQYMYLVQVPAVHQAPYTAAGISYPGMPLNPFTLARPETSAQPNGWLGPVPKSEQAASGIPDQATLDQVQDQNQSQVQSRVNNGQSQPGDAAVQNDLHISNNGPNNDQQNGAVDDSNQQHDNEWGGPNHDNDNGVDQQDWATQNNTGGNDKRANGDRTAAPVSNDWDVPQKAPLPSAIAASSSETGPRNLYGPHGAYYSLTAIDLKAPQPVANEEPRYDVPAGLAHLKHGSTKQVQPGPGYMYAKKRAVPEYIDSIDRPYARFVFKYRNKAQILSELGVDIGVEPSADQEVAELASLPTQTLIEMLIRARSGCGGTIPPPLASSQPVNSKPASVPAPDTAHLKYTLPPARKPSMPQARPSQANASAASQQPTNNWDVPRPIPHPAPARWSDNNVTDNSGTGDGRQTAANGWDQITPIPLPPQTNSGPPEVKLDQMMNNNTWGDTHDNQAVAVADVAW